MISRDIINELSAINSEATIYRLWHIDKSHLVKIRNSAHRIYTLLKQGNLSEIETEIITSVEKILAIIEKEKLTIEDTDTVEFHTIYLLGLIHGNDKISALKAAKAEVSRYKVRIRPLLSEKDFYSRYCRASFKVEDGAYIFWNNKPFLITLLPRELIEELTYGPETNWITRTELKILLSLSFSRFIDHGPNMYFQLSPETHDLPGDLILDNRTSLTDEALEEAKKIYLEHYIPKQDLNSEPYEFYDEGFSQEHANRFHKSFNIQDNLSLRTGFCLIKSATLWAHKPPIFGEDAFANLAFALEGCLHLIHRRFFNHNDKLKMVFSHIEKTFPESPGYRSMLEAVYEQRVQIVHPDPRNSKGWVPEVYADDFYENYGMAVDLFYYAIVGETLPNP